MNLYRTYPYYNFLESITDFILDNKKFSNDLSKIKIILPTGMACYKLQEIIVKKKIVTLLPSILPLSSIIKPEKFLSNLIENETISLLEEKIFLADEIYNSSKLDFSIAQALNFAPSLAKLLNYLICDDITLESINELCSMNQSKHWQMIYDFLSILDARFKKKLSLIGKISTSNYQINSLNSVAESLSELKNDEYLILAGFFGHDHSFYRFIKNIACHKQGIVILPPVPGNFEDMEITNNKDMHNGLLLLYEDPFFSLRRLLKFINKKLSELTLLTGQQEKKHVIDLLTLNANQNINKNNYSNEKPDIEYYELENQFLEADFISNICLKYISKYKNNPCFNIGIISNNPAHKEYYKNLLLGHDLAVQDLIGNEIKEHHISCLILNMSKVIFDDFNLKNLFILLKNPLIDNEFCRYGGEKLFLDNHRFINSWKKASDLVAKSENNNLIDSFLTIRNILEIAEYKNDFYSMLTILLSKAEKICKHLWIEDNIKDFYMKLAEIKWDIKLKEKQEFYHILKELLSGQKFFPNSSDNGFITICSPKEALFLPFDIVILTDFNEDNWAAKSFVNPWLNMQMVKDLNIYSQIIDISSDFYHFYSLLYTHKIIITRSKSASNNKEKIPSNYLLKLQQIIN